MQKKKKYIVSEILENTAEIHTFISFVFKNTDGTETIYFFININSITHKTLLQNSTGTQLLHISSILLAVQ